MLDEVHPDVPGESVRTAGNGHRDAATSVRDSAPDGTPHAAQQADPLPFLIADAEPAVLGRTVLAVAAMHEPDEHGRCRICSTRWRWRRSRGESWCSTRRMLWATLVGSQPAGAN